MDVIDALVVELALDPTKYTEEEKKFLAGLRRTKEEALETAKDIEHSGKRAAEFYVGINKAATALFTVLAGTGLVQFARATTESVAATGRLAQSIGISTQEVSAFSRMIERNGGSADAAAESIKNLALQATNFQYYGQASAEFMNFLNVIGGDAAKSATENYMKFVEFAERNRDKPALVTLIGQQGGLDPASINEAMKGVARVRADLAASKAIGVPSDADAAKLQHLLETWRGVDQAIETVGRHLILDVADPLSNIADTTTKWLERNQKIAEGVAAIATGIVALNAIKPALWVLRLLGLGAVASPAGAAAAAAGASALATQYLNTNVENMGFPRGTTFDPEGGFVMPITPSGGGERSAQLRAMDYFISQGWSVNQAAAIVANGMAESGLDPGAANVSGGLHQGVFQWSRARRDSILAGTGIDVFDASFDDQLRAAQWELTHTEKRAGDALRGAGTAEEGAVLLDRLYERSGDTSALEQHRALLAGSIANSSSTDASTSVHIDSMTVNTRATDADGVARDMTGAIKRSISGSKLAVQANTGLN